MREILFRGKRKDNGEWVFGDLIRNLIYDGREKEMRIGDIYFEHNGDIHGTAVYKVIPETVGQFTGLTDKNGTKIFEGDIVKYYGICKPIIGVVKICEEDFSGLYGVCEAFTDGSGTSLLKSKIDCQVVGNIYDNPELLEEL